MLRETIGIMRDLPRLQEISAVLIRHGLGDIVRRFGIVPMLEQAGQMLNFRAAAESVRLMPAERMRLAFEELGPTFVKLGQVLATRIDLFPPDWIAEFEKLHTAVPPVPIDDLLPQVTEALGRSPFEIFRELEREPFASASIAQVHRAKLQDGTPVVLKIRRPGIREKIEADIRILEQLAALLEAENPDARRYQPVAIVGHFARSIERELDLALEARNIERFGANFAEDPLIVIPKVYEEWTSPVMNVQEHIVGILGNDMPAAVAAGLDPKLLAARGAEAVLRMILIDGFFHADPHPGNVYFLPDNRIAIIDFGMVGRLSPLRRNQVIDLLAGLGRLDEAPMIDVLLEWAGDAYVDDVKLASDLNDLVFEFEGVPLKDIRIAVLLRHFADLVREHKIVIPSDLALMFKAIITLEGLGRQYDPDFQVIDHLLPLLRRARMERFQPEALVKRGRNAITDFLEVVGSVPRDLSRLLRDARRGKTRVDLDLKRLDQFGIRLDCTIDRATMGILTASVVIGSSIVMTVQGGPTVFEVPLYTLLGLTGYLIAFCNSAWIIFGIWRSRK